MPVIDKAVFGFAAESTWGTGVTVTKFLPLLSEQIRLVKGNTVSRGLRSGLYTPRGGTFVAWNEKTEGNIALEVTNKTWGSLAKAALGATATSGPNADGAYTHVLTEASQVGQSLTMQFNRPDSTDANRAFTYAGCSTTGWTIHLEPGGLLMWEQSFTGKSEDTATALATASYASGLTPFDWTQITTFTVGGATVNARSFSLSASIPKNTDRRRLTGTTTIGQPVANGWRDYSGSFVLDFDSLTDYNRFVNATATAVQIVFTGALIAGASSYKLTIDIPQIRFTGETPNLSGPDFPLAVNMPFTVFYDDSNSPVKFTLITTDVTV